jgi:hypothetical protein
VPFAVRRASEPLPRARPRPLPNSRTNRGSWERRSAPVWSDRRVPRAVPSVSPDPHSTRELPIHPRPRGPPWAVRRSPFAVQSEPLPRDALRSLPNSPTPAARGSGEAPRCGATEGPRAVPERQSRPPLDQRTRQRPTTPRAALGRSPFAVRRSEPLLETRSGPSRTRPHPAPLVEAAKRPGAGATTEPACRSRASAQTRLDRGTPPSDPRLPGAALGRCRPPTVTSRHPPATSGHADPALRASGTRGRPGRPGARLAAPAGTARPG